MVHGGPHAKRQQRHQRSGGYELGHRLVGKADQFVPEGACQQGRPPGSFAGVASGKDVHACGNRQGDRAEQQLDAADIPERLAKADGVEQQKDAGHGSGHQPGARTVEVLPVGDAAPEDQAVCRLQVLHDLVGVQNEVTRQSHGGPGRKCQRQYQRQIFPRPVGRPRMQQDLERRPYPWQDGLHRGPRRSTPVFPWSLPLRHFREALIVRVPACRR